MSYRTLFCIGMLIISKTCASNEIVKLAVENSWPPYSDINGNGISKDIIKKAYHSVNVDVEFVVVPYARALYMAEVGLVDGAFNVTKQETTIEKFKFGHQEILQASASFYYNKDAKINFNSANDIPTGSSVAVIIGYEYGNNYEKNKARFKETRVSNQKQIIKLIRNNRVDLGIMFDEVAQYTLAEMGFKADDIKQGKINHQSSIYVAFSKKKDIKNALELLDQGLIKIKQQGAINNKQLITNK